MKKEVYYMNSWYEDLRRILFIAIGTFLMALGTNAILIPNKLLSGGVSGIAMFFNLIFGWNMSVVIIVINIPLFVLAFLFLKRRFIIFSLIGLLFFTLWLQLTTGWSIPIESSLSIPLLAGVINGAGAGIIFRGDGSTAGTDIIAKIANKFFSLNMATTNFIVNIVIIVLSVYFFSVDLAVLTVATMYISTRTANFVVEGLNIRRTVLIITDDEHAQHIANDIMKRIRRGVTMIPAIGAFTNKPRYILYTTVGIRELAKVKMITLHHDPKAFMTVTETAQVIGNGRGFLKLRED